MKKIACNRDLGFTSTREEGEAVLREKWPIVVVFRAPNALG